MRGSIVLPFMVLIWPACSTLDPPTVQDPLVERGRELFFNETFDGNGRTCGTCHPAENNFTLDPLFIATLPPDNPLFVAEFNPDLSDNFENPTLMRSVGLILENQDGFEDLAQDFNMRGIPHTLGLATSIDSPDGPRTGWAGDGSPGDGSLRSFATGAVIQHFTLTTNRVSGVDFRLPTDDELDALEAFQRSLGRKNDIVMPLPLKNPVALRGQELFNDPETGKCFACHVNAGANASPDVFGENPGNINFNTGVEDLPDQPGDLLGELNPPDDGFGIPGAGEFNVPSLIEAADTGPFFHNNSVATLEAAVGFYDGDSFNESPAGQLIAEATGEGIEIDATQIEAIATFLRVINTLQNISESIEFLDSYASRAYVGNVAYEDLPARAGHETDDAIEVLTVGGLHPDALAHLGEARNLITLAISADSFNEQRDRAREAIQALELARDLIVEP